MADQDRKGPGQPVDLKQDPPLVEDVSEEELQHIMAKFDKDSNTRHFTGMYKTLVSCLCVAFTALVLIMNTVWLQPPQIHRSIFAGLIILYSFLLYPTFKKNNVEVNYIPWYDFVLAFVGLACFLYHAINFRTIVGQMALFTQTNYIVAVVGIVILFVACYRVVGLPLMIVVACFLAYALFGQSIPGIFGHAGVRPHRLFTFLFYTTEGVIGIPTGVASTFIFVFVLFGAFLDKTGISQFFIDISNAIAGKAVGGPAKVAVIVSAFSGTISGSSVANTVATGSFTIPMMKRMGYDKDFAGAVEAASSTGGQIMPPVMGAAAFLMAEITGIPYAQIALASLIPAALYFVCLFAAVHFEAKKKKLRGMPADEIPKVIPLILQKGQLLLGIAAVVFFLSRGNTPTRSALYGILVSLAVSMVRKDTRLTPKKIFEAMEAGARNIVGVGVACAMAGIIVGVVTLTGMGISFANSMLAMAQGIGHETLRLLMVLFFCMIASLILGMGVPTTAKYVILATVTAPILEQLGVPRLAAHLFVLYFGTDADITPPVALAAYAGAAIARGNPMRTSFIATRIAIAAYIVPYFFVFNPKMLFIDAAVYDIIHLSISAIVGIICVSSGLSGYLMRYTNVVERVLLIVAGLALITPGWGTDIIGIAVLGGICLLQKIRKEPLEAI